MNTLTVILLLLAFVTSILGGVMLLVAAFRQSLLWGLAYLLILFASLVFLIRHWDEAKDGFWVSVIGALLCVGVFFTLPDSRQSLCGAFEKTHAVSAAKSNTLKKLTDEIQKQRERIRLLEDDLTQAGDTLTAQYRDITAKRQTLNSNDPAAVVRFNEEATAYQKLNEQWKQKTQNLAAARQELNDLLDQRAKQMPPPKIAKKVVIYTTSRCPACEVAKRYFNRKGIPYEDMNVDNSSAALEEYQRLNSDAFPLILIGDKRMEGFNARAVDAALQ